MSSGPSGAAPTLPAGRAGAYAAPAGRTRRLLGETVPMLVPTERKGLMDLLRGRRAA